MNVIGVVAEYNPFHTGHLHHLTESRRLVGQDTAVICVMSGNFVQRGDAAVYDKFTRAEAAVRCGADLVFELPLPWALSSAEGFARGAVGLLGSLGVVTHLSFGSEEGSVEPLLSLAEVLLDPRMDELIKRELDSGISYAAAREKALETMVGQQAALLKTPNNILAVEYLKALYSLRLDMKPVTVLRSGAGHDRTGPGHKSASELRGRISAGLSVEEHIPAEAMAVYRKAEQEGKGPVELEDLELAILSRLRFLSEAAFHNTPDAAEGLGGRLCRAAWAEYSFDGILSAAKTKRYALSRLRRMLLSAALGVTAGMAEHTPPYARILAAGPKGRQVLRIIGEKSSLPVITKPAAVKNLDAECRNLFALEAAATDLYVLGYPVRQERRGGKDWRQSPYMDQHDNPGEKTV